MQLIRHCEQCRTFSETPLCLLCRDPARDAGLLCIVESPIDVAAIEQMGSFRGLYFVLMGHLSPLDGIGPADIGMSLLEPRLHNGKLSEIILATNPTVEGEATAHYIATLAKRAGCRATRIAYGVPMGGELEYLDGGTLARAFAGRGDA
jgi:recombination protein RecR